MKSNELRAVLAKTKDVAIFPVHIEGELPYYATARHGGVAVCPRGLVRATVVETGVAWTERRPVAECGDQEYDIPHRNGILVEMAAPPSKPGGQKRAKHRVPHSSVIERDGEKFVHLIVSHRAIIAPWGEYALIEAQREKDEAEQREKHERGLRALTALMGLDAAQCAAIPLSADYVQQYKYEADGDYKRDEEGRRIMVKDQGRVQLTLERAEELLAVLTPKQKRTLGIAS